MKDSDVMYKMRRKDNETSSHDQHTFNTRMIYFVCAWWT